MYNVFSKIAGKDNVFFDEPMKNHTTFRIGGKADYYIKCKSVDVIVALVNVCKENNFPFFILGNGSNILVGDGGIRGVVLHLNDSFSSLEFDEKNCLITAQAGILISKLASLSAKKGMSGLECLSGIPGTLGGALYMNAGAYGDEISKHVKQVTFLDEDLTLKTISCEECCFGYRKSIFAKRNKIILSAVLQLTKDDPVAIKARMAMYTERRISKQPIEKFSAGSTFKRPEGHFAGSLIEKSGLKGKTIGAAQVSEKHAGFIINTGFC